MKQIVILLLSALLSLSCTFTFNCGSGVHVSGSCSEKGMDFSEERGCGFFDSIAAEGPFNVYFVQADTQRVVVEGKKEFVEKLRTDVRDKTLSIKLEDGNYFNLVLKVTVYSPSVEEIEGSGSGNVICSDINLPDSKLEFASAGSGEFVLANVSCRKLELSTAGSGDAKIQGALVAGDEVEIESAGSGSVYVESVQGKDLEVAIAGSGSVKIKSAVIQEDVELSTAGSGSIQIDGKCAKVEAATCGSGSISGKLEYTSIEKKSIGSGKVKL